jgi:putative ABC transport system permease protein
MIKYYFKTAWRNLIKRNFYSGLNILGLSLGITCSLFLYIFISYHFSFDRYHKNASTTYRVLNELYFGKTLHEKGASIAMFRELSSGLANVSDAAVILSNYTYTITVNDSSKAARRFKEDKNVALVSPGWFKMFDYKWIAGNPGQLNLPNTAVITQKQSEKYFGNSDPIGKIIVFENKQPVTIVGLLSDKPYNTDLKSDIFVSLSSLKNLSPGTFNGFFTDWGWMNSTTSLYITLNNKKNKSEAEAAINTIAKSNLGDNSKYYHFWLQPLADVHFNTDYGGDLQKSLLVTLMIIGVLILMIAAFNYINISIAQQSKRMTEIGTRKVLGGTTWQLFNQFMIETFIMVSLAIILSVVIGVLIFPAANQFLFSDDPVHLLSYKNIIIFLTILLLFLTFLSGIYPSFVLSRINIFKALKNNAGTWKAGLLRKTLVVVQNGVAYILVICAIVMILQVRFMQNTDMGFDRNSVVMIPLPDSSASHRELLKEKLKEMPQASVFTFCFKSPSSDNDNGGSVEFDNRPDWETWPARSAIGDTSYVKTFELKIIAGRNFLESKASPEYLVNETMVNKLGLKSPEQAIGKSLVVGQFGDRKGTIEGVVKDFNTKSLEVPIEPVVIANIPDQYSTMAVKLKRKDLQVTLQKIQQDWQETYSGEVFEDQFLDDQIARLYQKEDLQRKIISVAGLIAIIISCLGLLGLASLVTLQRTKEIGIRKVLGASARGIVELISKDFLQLVTIAIIFSTPLAWLVMNKWLQNFAYHISISWWIFILAAVLAILVALITISFQAVKAAVANPVESLRTE